MHLFVDCTNALASARAGTAPQPATTDTVSAATHTTMRAAVLAALIGTAQAVVMTRRRMGAAAAAGLAAQLAPAQAADDDLPTRPGVGFRDGEEAKASKEAAKRQSIFSEATPPMAKRSRAAMPTLKATR